MPQTKLRVINNFKCSIWLSCQMRFLFVLSHNWQRIRILFSLASKIDLYKLQQQHRPIECFELLRTLFILQYLGVMVFAVCVTINHDLYEMEFDRSIDRLFSSLSYWLTKCLSWQNVFHRRWFHFVKHKYTVTRLNVERK